MFLGTFLVPISLVLIFNSIMLAAAVWISLSHNRRKAKRLNSSTRRIVHDTLKALISIVGLAFLFGVTWLFGALTVSGTQSVFHYLFVLFNAFQGLYLFIFMCGDTWKKSFKLSKLRRKLVIGLNKTSSDSSAGVTKKTVTTGITSPTSSIPAAKWSVNPGSQTYFDVTTDSTSASKNEVQHEAKYEGVELEMTPIFARDEAVDTSNEAHANGYKIAGEAQNLMERSCKEESPKTRSHSDSIVQIGSISGVGIAASTEEVWGNPPLRLEPILEHDNEGKKKVKKEDKEEDKQPL